MRLIVRIAALLFTSLLASRAEAGALDVCRDRAVEAHPLQRNALLALAQRDGHLAQCLAFAGIDHERLPAPARSTLRFFVDGEQLFQACRRGQRSSGSERGLCEGYVAAFVDLIRAIEARAPTAIATAPAPLFCALPAAGDLRRLTNTLLSELRKHPEYRSGSAAAAVWNALSAEYGCSGAAEATVRAALGSDPAPYFMDDQRLAALCANTGPSRDHARGLCQAFLAGVYDTTLWSALLVGSAQGRETRAFCSVPSNLAPRHLEAIWRGRNEQQHSPAAATAAVTAFDALLARYRCAPLRTAARSG